MEAGAEQPSQPRAFLPPPAPPPPLRPYHWGGGRWKRQTPDLCMYVCLYVCMSVCMYRYTFVGMCVCEYIYIHIYIWYEDPEGCKVSLHALKQVVGRDVDLQAVALTVSSFKAPGGLLWVEIRQV